MQKISQIQPVVISSAIRSVPQKPDDIAALTDALEHAGADEVDGDNGLDLSVYGRAYEYIYTKQGETELTIKNLPPENTFMVYDDTIEQNELFGVYYYARIDSTDKTNITYIATVLTQNYKYVLDIQNIQEPQALTEHPEAHFKGEVPLIEYENNKLALGDYELQIPLIDAYNVLMSMCSDRQGAVRGRNPCIVRHVTFR